MARRPFPRFDVVPTCPLDHHYYGSDASAIASGTQKEISREWKLLESHLPDAIHVRAYENRINLLRAAIGGVAGTPYHDGLFFFDVAFPADYPNHPPRVHYRSFGLNLNPNLYPSGYVCLSLLNTWAGKKGERWDPAQSTLLQVLLSIQALVLNDRPYFNEPMLGALRGIEACEGPADSYSDECFYLSCKMMSFLVCKPPNDFEALVVEHFLERGPGVLLAISAYVNGRAEVGHYDPSSHSRADNDPGSVRRRHVRKRFKKQMMELYPVMVNRFQRCGATVDDLVELKLEPVNKRIEKGGTFVVFKKAWRKFKGLLGLKRSV